MDSQTNPELLLAFDFVKYTNRNIFLTGKAGTGKTTFLHDVRKASPKRMIVVAPTGVAAINAGGVTIHSFFQLPFHPFVPASYEPAHNTPGAEAQKVLPDYKMSREKINIIRSLDLLVIDEISMVRADTLDAIDAALRRYKNRNLPFGGVQLLMIGDLQQLAPVVKDDDAEILNRYYDTPFFFSSHALHSADYLTIELKHIYRQSDQLFIDILNKVRDNRIDQMVLDELNKRYFSDFDPDTGGGYITLTTHNYQSQAINDSKLEKLPGNAHIFNAIIKDEFPEYSYPTASELVLKVGAQVMFVRNDSSRDKLYFNGKIGKITAFADDIIMVQCPGEESPIRVEMTEWQNMKFTLDEETKEIEETPIGSFTQYPLRLAWAITIHKSQGLTFDRAVIDAHAAFAHGQVYVALSRCRTLEGLVLSKMISQRSIIDDPSITGFVNETKQYQPDRRQLDESKKEYQRQLLMELFDFNPLLRSINYCIKIVNEHSHNLIGDLGKMLGDASTCVSTDIIVVSEKFRPQLLQLLAGGSDAESNPALQERVTKACDYFSGKIKDGLKDILEGISVETDNKAVRRAVTEALERIRKEGLSRLACLSHAGSGFTVSGYLEAKAKAAIEEPRARKDSAKHIEDTSGSVKHPALFKNLKEWRNARATEKNIPHYMILPQKTMVTLANFAPQSLSDLKRVKGMGKKKAEQFGEEILEIIISYCKGENIEPAPELTETSAEVKKPKKIKEDTKKITLGMFNEGKTPAEIARERSLSLTTIEGHLAYYVGTGEIALDKVVSRETAELIMAHFRGDDELRIAPVKEALGDSVSWSEIKYVAAHLRYSEKAV
ncbi:MAG TPA: HRDC domain-containing protein [Bacteroidales bacterium]|nr:HRDC domain-containing protein [Bacteroidales bacterium]